MLAAFAILPFTALIYHLDYTSNTQEIAIRFASDVLCLDPYQRKFCASNDMWKQRLHNAWSISDSMFSEISRDISSEIKDTISVSPKTLVASSFDVSFKSSVARPYSVVLLFLDLV